MKTLLFSFFVSFLFFTLHAQIECNFITINNFGFEESLIGCNSNNAFNDECVFPWFGPHGSPNLINNNSDLAQLLTSNSQEGEHFAGIAAIKDNFQPPNNCRNEAIAINLPFVEGNIYTVTFYSRTSSLSASTVPISAKVVLANNQSNVPIPGGLEQCSNLIFSSDATNVFQLSNFETDIWMQSIFTFTANGINDQLVFYCEQNINQSPFSPTYWLLDNLTIEECDPCPSSLNPEFDISTSPAGTGFQLVDIVNFEDYSEIEGIHEWIVLTSSSPEGPYNLLNNNQSYNTDDFPLTLPEGIYYTIINKVTLCDVQACYGQNHCSNCSNGFNSNNCKYCGHIENCDISLNPSCPIDEVPINLACEYDGNDVTFTWSVIENAIQYQIQFGGTSTRACRFVDPGGPLGIFTTSNPYYTSTHDKCFCWRVRVLCEDGSTGNWSNSVCNYSKSDNNSFCNLEVVASNREDNSDVYQKDILFDMESISVSPNPSSDYFLISWMSPELHFYNLIRIYDFSGKIIYESMLDNDNDFQWKPDNFIKNGVYVLSISGRYSSSTKKIIIMR